MDDLNIVEVLDDRNAPVPAGGHGRVVLTNLYNYTLPVLRYELGRLRCARHGKQRNIVFRRSGKIEGGRRCSAYVTQ